MAQDAGAGFSETAIAGCSRFPVEAERLPNWERGAHERARLNKEASKR